MLVSGYSYAPFKALPGVKVFVGPGPCTLTVGLVPGVLGLLKVHWLAPDPFELLGLHVRTVGAVVPIGCGQFPPPLVSVQRLVGTI